MKLKWIYGALLAFTMALSIPSSAQISIFIGTPPPVIVYREPGPPPTPQMVWVEGYWVPQGNRYRWVEGHWERPPFEGAAWVHPHYDHYREGWMYHEGYWAHEDHDNHYAEYKHKGHDRDDDHHDHGNHGDHDR